jgi:hypothetical protein
MDPIHPILPTAPNIPPVTAAPLTGAVDRDARREKGAEADRRAAEDRRRRAEEERRRRAAEERRRRAEAQRSEDDLDTEAEGHGGPHIDLTA